MFSVVDAVLLRPLPYPEADRLVMLWSTMESQGLPTSGSAMPNFRYWRDQTHVFEELGAFTYGDFNLSGQNYPERVRGAIITPNIFRLLGISPVLGRGFLPEEDQFGRHFVVLLSHGLWQRRHGSDPQILGQSVKLSGENYTVVGVMPQSMPFLDNSRQIDLWTPLSFAPDSLSDSRTSHFAHIIGRLKDGATGGHHRRHRRRHHHKDERLGPCRSRPSTPTARRFRRARRWLQRGRDGRRTA